MKRPTFGQVKVKKQSRCRHWKSNGITCEEIWSVGRWERQTELPGKGFRNGSAEI